MKIHTVILIVGMLVSVPSIAKTYYVATTGNDSNIGTKIAPLRTIQKAADIARAGDTVRVKTGLYKEKVFVRNSGMAGRWITFTAEPNVTIDATNINMNWEGIFTIANASYIKVLGFYLSNSNEFGAIAYNSHHIRFERNYTYNTTSSGLAVWGSHNMLLNRNTVEKAVNGGKQECITVASSDHVQVFNNEVHHKGTGDNGGEGIDVKEGSAYITVKSNHVHDLYNKPCLYVDPWDAYAHHIVLDGNKLHGCNEGISLASEMGGTLDNVTIQNNVVYANRINGLVIGSWGIQGSQKLQNIFIQNNTFFDNGHEMLPSGVINQNGGGILILNPEITNVIVQNNILSKNTFYQLADRVGDTRTLLDNNLVDGAVETYGNNPIIADPQFVDSANANFHLLSGSPAIDQGIAIPSLKRDFDNKVRPIGTIDLGAFEYQIP